MIIVALECNARLEPWQLKASALNSTSSSDSRSSPSRQGRRRRLCAIELRMLNSDKLVASRKPDIDGPPSRQSRGLRAVQGCGRVERL